MFHVPYPNQLINNVKNAFPETVPVRPALLAGLDCENFFDLAGGDIYFKFYCSGVKMNVSFLFEGAGYSNLFGYFTFTLQTSGNQTKAVITNEVVIFPQVDSPNCLLSPNATTIQFGPFDESLEF